VTSAPGSLTFRAEGRGGKIGHFHAKGAGPSRLEMSRQHQLIVSSVPLYIVVLLIQLNSIKAA